MVVSPSVLSKGKKAKKVASSVSFADAVNSRSTVNNIDDEQQQPIASTSRVPIDDVDMDDNEDDGVEGDGKWEGGATRTTAGHPAGQGNQQDNDDDNDDAIMIDPDTLFPPSKPSTTTTTGGIASSATVAEADQGLLKFPALSAKEMQGKVDTQTRKVSIPPHRMTPLKRDWLKIYSPLVDECGLMVRMNVNKKNIEMKTTKHTPAPSNTILQRAVDFVAAYGLGFSAEDAIALLRMEDLFVETFEIRDVKTLHGDHLSRAIGRIAGKDGKTRFTIENVSRTRIVLADQKIHILGTFSSIKVARDAICALILGSPPGKVYNNLRTVAARQRQRF